MNGKPFIVSPIAKYLEMVIKARHSAVTALQNIKNMISKGFNTKAASSTNPSTGS